MKVQNRLECSAQVVGLEGAIGTQHDLLEIERSTTALVGNIEQLILIVTITLDHLTRYQISGRARRAVLSRGRAPEP